MARFIDELKRTHTCGALREGDIGEDAVLFGWVQRRRDMGGFLFVDLRRSRRDHAARLRPGVRGLRARERAPPRVGDRRARQGARPRCPQDEGRAGEVAAQSGLPTGAVEVLVEEADVFNKAETPPFEIEDDIDTQRGEAPRAPLPRSRGVRDCRRTSITRHNLNRVTREYFCDKGFLEIETPYMVKYTPGGARAFLVPSRVHHGNFYALAESPQLYKQLLMVRGLRPLLPDRALLP